MFAWKNMLRDLVHVLAYVPVKLRAYFFDQRISAEPLQALVVQDMGSPVQAVGVETQQV